MTREGREEGSSDLRYKVNFARVGRELPSDVTRAEDVTPHTPVL